MDTPEIPQSPASLKPTGPSFVPSQKHKTLAHLFSTEKASKEDILISQRLTEQAAGPSSSQSPPPATQIQASSTKPLKESKEIQEMTATWKEAKDRLDLLSLTVPHEMLEEFAQLSLLGETTNPQKKVSDFSIERLLSGIFTKAKKRKVDAFSSAVTEFERKIKKQLARKLNLSEDQIKSLFLAAENNWESFVKRTPDGLIQQNHGIKGLLIVEDPVSKKRIAFFKKESLGSGAIKTAFELQGLGVGKSLSVVRLKSVAKEASAKEQFLADVQNEISIRDSLPPDADVTGMTQIQVIGKKGDQKILYFMEKYDGSVEKVWPKRENPRTDQEAFRNFLRLIKTMSSLHERNLQHCDIKLDNLLTRMKRWFLNDFGLCTTVGSPKKISSPNASYMAPELCLHAIVGPKIDHYEFGMALLQFFEPGLFSSKQFPLILVPGNLERFKGQLEKLQEELRKKGDPLSMLIHDLIQFDPEKRPSDQEVLQRFEAICQGLFGKKFFS